MISEDKTMSENRCIYCNVIIPEGRMVCPKCEQSIKNNDITEREMLEWLFADLDTIIDAY